MKQNPHKAAQVWYDIPGPFLDPQRARVSVRVMAIPGLTGRPEPTPAR